MPYELPTGQTPASDLAVAAGLLCMVGRRVVRREHPAGNKKTNGRLVVIAIFQASSQAAFVSCPGQSRMLPAPPKAAIRMAKNTHVASGVVYKYPQNRNCRTTEPRLNAQNPYVQGDVARLNSQNCYVQADVARPSTQNSYRKGDVALLNSQSHDNQADVDPLSTQNRNSQGDVLFPSHRTTSAS